jgi:hypothetical protein
MDGAPACPFVAFGDDRDGRSTSPDHRHRCFAETPPAPRALAHQEAYCLSSAFPVCPTFQDWARREAAHARGTGEPAQDVPTATPVTAQPDLYDDWAIPPAAAAAAGAAAAGAVHDPADESIPRNPPRDWAAPPPWATGQPGTGGAGRSTGTPSSAGDPAAGGQPVHPVEGQGLAGSPADRVAAGEVPAAMAWSASAAGSAHTPPDEELAGLVQGRSSSAPADGVAPVSSAPPTPPVSRSTADVYPASTSSRRPAVSSTRPSADSVPGPSWERMRHLETYPAIKTRSGGPGLPRVALLAGALGIAALALFMLPALLGIGGGGGSASASPSSSGPASTASASPTAVPAPTQLVYTVQKGDTLSRIAKKFSVDLADLLAANPDIKDPNTIKLGQQIVIPLPTASAPTRSAEPTDSTAPE